MKVVICAIDFRAYFPPRIRYFGEYLKRQGNSLEVIELFSESVCYQFSKDTFGELPHHVLFQGRYDGKLSMSAINKKLITTLDEINPDAIISADVNFPAGAGCLQWTKKHKKGLVVFTNSRSDSFKKSALVNAVKRSLLRGVEAVLCPASPWDDSMKALGFKQEQIFYGLNTGDNDFWSIPATNEHFPELPPRYFLHVGRHITQKNLVQFCRAYKQYRAEGGTRPLVLVGDGYTHADVCNEINGMKDVFLLQFQPRERLREIYQSAYALFLPSYKQETWGMVVNEAMCGGCPIVISEQCGSATTIVKEEVNGYIHHPDDIGKMTELMHRMDFLTEADWKRMSDASRAIIKDWGLERFAQGAYDACIYAIAHVRHTWNPIDLLLRHIWKGRIVSDDL